MKAQRFLKPISIVLITAALMLTLLPSMLKPQAQTFSATLTPLAGLVQVLPVGQTEWKTVNKTTLINQGDQVRTGSTGTARLNVVSGIEVDIYPVTVVELHDLRLGDGTRTGIVYNLFHLVGALYVKVDMEVTARDRVEVTLPLAGTRVRGTEWYTFVTNKMDALVMGTEDTVEIRGPLGKMYRIDKDEAYWVFVTLEPPLPLVCSAQVLSRGVGERLISEKQPGGVDVTGLRDHLREDLIRNVNPQYRNFLHDQLGIPQEDFITMTLEDEDKILKELVPMIEQFDAKGDPLAKFLETYRTFWQEYWSQVQDTALSLETCGNNVEDAGETQDNCENDFNFKPYCGNGFCETDRFRPGVLGESAINCPDDCRIGNGLDQSCALTTNNLLNPPPPSGGGRPTPSGVGGN